MKRRHLPLLATTGVFLVLYVVLSIVYEGFFSIRTIANLFGDNAFLGITAIAMTFVILSGGIDLSVGAMIGFTSILVATLFGLAWPPSLVFPVALLIGVSLGAGMGSLIHFFRLPPFLVTLGGMFLIRGLGHIISLESLAIDNAFYRSLNGAGIVLGSGNGTFSISAIIFLIVFGFSAYFLRWTRFGRTVYALGGSESSSLLMGLKVGSARVGIYAYSGFLSALAGIVFTFYMQSGNSSGGTMLELDAIAAVVIGGTLLTGGVGNLWGTLVGVLILGTIQNALIFQGTLSSWWTKIAIGVLLLVFIVLQRFFRSLASKK